MLPRKQLLGLPTVMFEEFGSRSHLESSRTLPGVFVLIGLNIVGVAGVIFGRAARHATPAPLGSTLPLQNTHFASCLWPR